MTYKIRTCETPLKDAMESGKVIAEGHVQLPAITPGETGKARFTLPASFREGTEKIYFVKRKNYRV